MKKRLLSSAIICMLVMTVFSGFAMADTAYTVKSGDALWKIADQYEGVDWKTIANHNGIKNPDFLAVGQVLNIPGTQAETVVATPITPAAPVVPEYATKDLNEQLVMATLWMQKSAEYRSLCYQAFNMGKLVIDAELAKEQDKPLAIIVDADETVIDNSAYQAGLIGQNFGYSSKTWTPWMNAAEAKAIPGATEFLKYMEEKGVEVFYVTNRKMVGYDGTVKNLKALGFPNVDEKHMLLRTGSSDKEERRQIVTKDYEVVLYMGDNLNDFSSEFGKKSVEERFAATDANKDKFGTQWIVFPNPTYGEWDGAIFQYNWGASVKEKDQMRKDSLMKWNVAQ